MDTLPLASQLTCLLHCVKKVKHSSKLLLFGGFGVVAKCLVSGLATEYYVLGVVGFNFTGLVQVGCSTPLFMLVEREVIWSLEY